MDNFESTPCEICGGTSFFKDSGYIYCNECQNQSQARDHVFDNDEVLKTHTHKAKRIQTGQSEVALTSWECYSTVLLGLTKELINLGANKQLKRIVKLLWLKYLHKCEVFELESQKPPKVSILGSKKDLTVLYNKTNKKRKRSASVASSGVFTISKQRKSEKSALIKKLSQSQQNQSQPEADLSVEALHNIKSSSEVSTERIRYNKFSRTELKRLMSKTHRKKHELDVNDELKCHKLNAKSFRSNFQCGPSNLTSFTLYGLLYIGLLISGDRIQLGDLLRYIREGNLSFGCYKHFFDPEIPDKLLNLPTRNEQLYSNGLFRKKCAKLAQFLDVTHFIVVPNFPDLCERFCRELNLPEALMECVKTLLRVTKPKMKFKQNSQTIPNYEARIMSLILFVLKLFYGLDGCTERKLNEFADYVDNELNGESEKMFKIIDWIEFICYRRNFIDSYHLPALLKNANGKFDADLYLNYLKMQKIQFKGTNRHIRSEVKDYIQILEKISTVEDENENEITRKFPASLNPLKNYVDIILKTNNMEQEFDAEAILKQDFAQQSLKYILEPKPFLKSFGTREIVHGGANDNFQLLDLLYLYKATIYASCRDKKKIVAVKLCKNPENEDKNVLKNLKNASSLNTTDIQILISNWNQGHAKEFAISEKNLLDEQHDESKKIRKKIQIKYPQHFNAYERYWINLPINPAAHYLGKQQMEKIAQNFPDSFRKILCECAKILEQDLSEIYAEFLITEIYLTNLNKSNSLNELKRTLKSIKENW